MEKRVSLYLVAATMFVFSSTSAFSKTIYLKCRKNSEPNVTMASFYKTPPKGLPDAFYADVMMQGLIGLILPPPDTWIIDSDSSTVRSTEHPEQYTLSRATIAVEAIHSTRGGSTFNLNRINGALRYTKLTDPEDGKRWKQAHGGELPTVFEWTYTCSAADKPAI